MNQEWHNTILDLLADNKAMGVNELAKHLSIPLSTMQKYLTTQQSYFKKNRQRKWDLPERVVEESSINASESHSLAIQSQLTGMRATFDVLNSQINNVMTLMETYTIPTPSVASKTTIDPRLLKFSENVNNMQLAIKKNVDKVPEIYRDLISNIDFLRLVLNKGREYVEDIVTPELSALVLKQSEILQPEIISLLTEYQTTTNRTE